MYAHKDAGKEMIMKNNLLKIIMGNRITIMMSLFLFTGIMLSGCGESDKPEKQNKNNAESISQESSVSDKNSLDSTDTQNEKTDAASQNSETELEVRFGDEGSPFMLQLNGSGTAAAIARYVGTSDWQLPIYEDDEDANYDVLQYYDIPSSYDIPSNPEKVTSVKAGEVYYSDPNRIVLFYQDAVVSEEYTPVGHFDATDEFVEAVKNNPVLEGWGNKIVLITKP